MAAIVRANIARHRTRSQEELDGFAREPTLAVAARRAGLARRPDGTSHDHQRRLTRALLEAAASELAGAGPEKARTFDDSTWCTSEFGRPSEPLIGIGALPVS